MRNRLRSTHLQLLSVIFCIELLLILALLFSAFHFVRSRIDENDRQQAVELRDDLLFVEMQQGDAALTKLLAARASDGTGDLFLLADGRGHRLAGNLPHWPAGLKQDRAWHRIWAVAQGDDDPRPYGVISAALPNGGRLLVGHLIESSADMKALVRDALLSVLLLAIPLAVAGAWAAARLIDLRIRTFTQTARAVASGRLDNRISLSGAQDGFDQLGETINVMLDRLARLVGELRLVTDSLAHDLRSPLTRLRAHVARGLRGSNQRALRDGLLAADEEAETLLGMLATSLEISRAQAGIGAENMEICRVDEVLRNLAELYEPLVEEQARRLEVDDGNPATARVHRELLVRALANLIDNALKHGAGRIGLQWREESDNIVVGVSDEGEGISPDREAEALRRFGRLDPARAAGGAGLGLSLVAAVAALHGGSVEFLRSDSAFAVAMRFPRGA